MTAAFQDERPDYSGQIVTIKESVKDPIQAAVVGGAKFRVEGYWDEMTGKSWRDSDGNFAATHYAMRIGMSQTQIPLDDYVLYGKIGAFGHMVHISEIVE